MIELTAEEIKEYEKQATKLAQIDRENRLIKRSKVNRLHYKKHRVAINARRRAARQAAKAARDV